MNIYTIYRKFLIIYNFYFIKIIIRKKITIINNKYNIKFYKNN